jgi:hypothetical protein
MTTNNNNLIVPNAPRKVRISNISAEDLGIIPKNLNIDFNKETFDLCPTIKSRHRESKKSRKVENSLLHIKRNLNSVFNETYLIENGITNAPKKNKINSNIELSKGICLFPQD